jgi:hypothetical protein
MEVHTVSAASFDLELSFDVAAEILNLWLPILVTVYRMSISKC